MIAQENSHGFTLIEMSLVLVIVGMVITTIFPTLKLVREYAQNQQTQSNLDTLIRATAAYVQANGCLPCPTPASTVGGGFGRVRGDMITLPCGACTQPEGVVPFASLGLPMNTAKDGWGRWITMRIDPALAINFGVTPPTTQCLPSDPFPCVQGESRKGLCQANLSNSNRINIITPGSATTQAAVLVLSHGANGYGSYHSDPNANDGVDTHPSFTGSLAPCSTNGGYERCNANGDRDFINASVSNDPRAYFDDSLRFLDRNALVSYLGNGACQTTW